jgi:hypothetical protein
MHAISYIKPEDADCERIPAAFEAGYKKYQGLLVVE